jgi:hypothetical protein
MKCFVKGITVIGSGDFGYVVVRPGSLAASDQNSVFYTDSSFAGTAIATSGTGVLAAKSNSDYVNAQFGISGVQFRLVTVGVRIKYRGTELNRGGRVIALEEPDHQSLIGLNASALLAYRQATSLRPTGGDKWMELVSSGPKVPEELEYSAVFSGGQTNGHYLVFAFEGQANMAFEFEVFANFELIGSAVRGKTPSHHDGPGAFAVSNALTVAADTGQDISESPTKRISKIGNLAKEFFKMSISSIGASLSKSTNPYAMLGGMGIKALTSL